MQTEANRSKRKLNWGRRRSKRRKRKLEENREWITWETDVIPIGMSRYFTCFLRAFSVILHFECESKVKHRFRTLMNQNPRRLRSVGVQSEARNYVCKSGRWIQVQLILDVISGSIQISPWGWWHRVGIVVHYWWNLCWNRQFLLVPICVSSLWSPSMRGARVFGFNGWRWC